MSSFGTKLKEVRKAKGMTQKDLASAIGAAHNSVSNWEHDQNEPALDVLKKICVVLGVSPEELLGQEKRDQVYHGVGYAEGELIKNTAH